MAETIRDVVVRITLDQVQTSLKVPNTTAFKDALKSVDKTSAGVASNAQSRMNLVKTNTQKTAEEARKELAKLGDDLTDLQLKSLESFRTMGDGMFTLARGAAFLSSSSEEDFQAMLKTITAVQGGFDLFRGTVDTVKGVIEGTRAVTAIFTATETANTIATNANTSAKAANAAANVTVGTTATGAVAPVTALSVAMGPIGIAAIAITAGVAGMAYAFTAFADDAEDSLDRVDEKMKRLQKAQARAAIDNNTNDPGALFRAKKTELEIDKQRIDLLRGEEESLTRRLELARKIVATTTKEKDFALLFASDQGFEAKGRLRSYEQAAFFQKELMTAKRLELNLTREAEKAQEVLISKKQREVDLAQQALDSEKERLGVLNSSIGRLDAKQFRELEQLSGRVKSGEELSREQLLRLESLGGQNVSGFTNQEFEKRGKERGAESLLAPFQPDDLNSNVKNLTDAQVSESKKLQKLIESFENSVKENSAISEASRVILETTFKELMESQNKIQKLEQFISDTRNQEG